MHEQGPEKSAPKPDTIKTLHIVPGKLIYDVQGQPIGIMTIGYTYPDYTPQNGPEEEVVLDIRFDKSPHK